VGHSDRKEGVDCSKLLRTSLDFAATKFVPLCDGISGTIGTLVVDGDYVEDAVAFPIDIYAKLLSAQNDYLETHRNIGLVAIPNDVMHSQKVKDIDGRE
jgi:hypothetical protein